MHRVTASVVTYQGEGLVRELSETLNLLPDVGCVIYDSGSSDETCRVIREMIPGAKLICGQNRGFGYGNNRCFENIDTEYTLLLNSDARIDRDSLAVLLKFLDENPAYAGVQPLVRLWEWNLVTASRGVFLTPYGEAWDSGFMHLEPSVARKPLEVPAVTAAVSLWRTHVLHALGGFDESFFMYFEDADLSLRAQASGWKLAVIPAACAKHMVGASSSRREASIWEIYSSVRMFRRYLGAGKLIRSLLNREFRVFIANLCHGRNPAPRLKAFITAAVERVDTVELPERVRTMLFGSPSDLPMRRLDLNDWNQSRAAPWMGKRLKAHSASITLESTEHAVTGALIGSGGEALQRFTVPAGGSRKYQLAVPGPVVYIKCDKVDDEVKVGIE